MRIFTICNKSPWPPTEGGSIAMNSIIEGLLKAGHQVKVLAVSSDKHPIIMENIPEAYRKKTGFETTYLTLTPRPWDAFLNLFTRKSYHIQRFISKEMENLEMLHVTPYIHVIRKFSKARIILRAHNIEHLIWERIAASTRNPIKRAYLTYLASSLKRYELHILKEVDGLAAITPVDGAFFRRQQPGLPVADIPFGITPRPSPPEVEEEFPALFHLGSMSWMPNSDGIRWFLDNVWPLVNRKYPHLKCYLAGRGMPQWLLERKDPNIINVGEVADARKFMRSKPIMIVPLLSGSGIRIKIIEGMQEGRTIISTTIGAEGICYTPGKDLLIADTPEAFVQMIEKAIHDRAFCKQIGRNAQKTISQVYDNRVITDHLISFYQSLSSER
ncbi:MAG: hypothetical protein CSA95_05440 [Bacteroidetes bacterium]|nr:MAG: hypothetical protein CSA95_05440 [Bacteroidota bacterium]